MDRSGPQTKSWDCYQKQGEGMLGKQNQQATCCLRSFLSVSGKVIPPFAQGQWPLCSWLSLSCFSWDGAVLNSPSCVFNLTLFTSIPSNVFESCFVLNLFMLKRSCTAITTPENSDKSTCHTGHSLAILTWLKLSTSENPRGVSCHGICEVNCIKGDPRPRALIWASLSLIWVSVPRFCQGSC